MITCIVAAALVVGPYSGVDLNTLLDKPMFVSEMVLKLSAADIAEQATGEQATGAKVAEVEGEELAVTEKGFELNVEAELPVGRCVLEVQARAPDRGTDSFWVAFDGVKLERPFLISTGPVGTRSIVADVTEAGKHTFRIWLRERPGSALRSVSVSAASTKMPKPPMRKELMGTHPRLFFTGADVEPMRARLEDKRVQQLYVLPGELTKKPPAFQPGKRNGGAFINLGSYALGYLLKPDEKQLAAIIEWLEMATTYPNVGVDLDAEYFIEGIALAYDWLYDELPEDLRKRVRATIARQCDLLYKASMAGATGGGLHYQQNHYWFAHLSLALGAAAVCGEEPMAEVWLAWAWDRYERIALTMSPDGSFHEGPAYWDYSMPTLYIYTDLYEWCTGTRIPAGDDGLRGQAQFRFQHMYPGLELTAALEDTRVTASRPPTKLALWEAKRYQDPVAMGIAERLNRGPSWDRFNLLWLDERVPAGDVEKAVPLGQYFEDVETAFARTSWADEGTYVGFVSRPLGGHKWAEICAKFGLGGTGHNHPEQNHFVLFGRGEVLAGDPGYTYEKQTRNHNTVLVDGQGQYGDGEMWPKPTPGRAHITGFVTDGDVSIMTGDAVSAYPEELGLTRFERTVVLAGRDLVVVCDRLAAKAPRTFSWLLHHWGETASEDGEWTITRGEAQVTVAPLLPENLRGETSTYLPQFVHPHRDLTPKDADIEMLELTSGPSTGATFLVPLLVGGAGDEVPEVEDVSNATCDAVRVGDTVVAFSNGAKTLAVDTPWGEKLESHAQVVVARVVAGKRQVISAPAGQ